MLFLISRVVALERGIRHAPHIKSCIHNDYNRRYCRQRTCIQRKRVKRVSEKRTAFPIVLKRSEKHNIKINKMILLSIFYLLGDWEQRIQGSCGSIKTTNREY